MRTTTPGVIIHAHHARCWLGSVAHRCHVCSYKWMRDNTQFRHQFLVYLSRRDARGETDKKRGIPTKWRVYTGTKDVFDGCRVPYSIHILVSKPFFSINPTLHRPLVPSGLISRITWLFIGFPCSTVLFLFQILKTKKNFGKKNFSLHYDQKNTLNPLVKSLLNPLTIKGDICNFVTAVSALSSTSQRSVYN